jgi:hypothetical protein
MNPLNNGTPSFNRGQSNELINNIQNVKQIMRMANGDINVLAQQYPQVGQILQMTKGQDLQSMFMNMCKQRGIDPNVILNELRN